MKSTDLRAKARAIFGPAIAEPMPNQPNGAKALQQRANARPIPTYKVGGVVKKADGGMMKPKVSEAERKMGDALMMKRKGKEIMAAQSKRDAEKERMGMAKRAVADKLLGIPAKKDGGKAGSGMKKGGKPKDGLAVMIAIGKPMKGMKKPVKKALGGGMDAKLSKAITAAAPKVRPTKGPAPQRILGTSMLAGVKNTGGISRVAPARMGSPIKRAVGGAGKTRKGMC